MVDTSVKRPVNEQTSVCLFVCWLRKELFHLVKLLGIATDNRKGGVNHCGIAVASANLMKLTLLNVELCNSCEAKSTMA